MGLNTPGAAHGDMDGWISMNPWARVPFVASYGFDAVVWTWLVIHYRYYRQPFVPFGIIMDNDISLDIVGFLLDALCRCVSCCMSMDQV
jgi:hypothetical protein